jgi:hypothetical protein
MNLIVNDINKCTKQHFVVNDFCGCTALVGLGLIVEVSRLHSDTTLSVRLLWNSKRPVGIRTHNPTKRTAADQRLRPRGHRHRPVSSIYLY